MRIEQYSELPPEAKALREEVFVKEQGFTLEFDETDGKATHFVGFSGEVPAATCRVYRDEVLGFVAGRIAVRKAFRGKGLGAEILRAAEGYVRERGGGEVVIGAAPRRAILRKARVCPGGQRVSGRELSPRPHEKKTIEKGRFRRRNRPFFYPASSSASSTRSSWQASKKI